MLLLYTFSLLTCHTTCVLRYVGLYAEDFSSSLKLLPSRLLTVTVTMVMDTCDTGMIVHPSIRVVNETRSSGNTRQGKHTIVLSVCLAYLEFVSLTLFPSCRLAVNEWRLQLHSISKGRQDSVRIVYVHTVRKNRWDCTEEAFWFHRGEYYPRGINRWASICWDNG